MTVTDCCFERVEERLRSKGFWQICHPAGLSSSFAIGITIAAGHENHGQCRGGVRELLLQIKTRLSLQVNVQYQTGRFLRLGARMEFGD